MTKGKYFPAIVALAHSAALAHHSPSAFDLRSEVTISGVVSDYEWANPHVYIYIESTNDAGAAKVWEIEGSPLSMMRRRGWTVETLSAGDRVTVTGNPGRSAEERVLRLTSLVKADGEAVANEEYAFEPAVRVTQTEGLAGIWIAEGQGAAWRLFTNPRTLPLTERGAEAARNFDESRDSNGIECIPFSIPMAMLLPDVKSIEIGADAIRIRGEFDAIVRTIHMDTDSHDGAQPSYLGHSIGRWEDETLVVDTTRFLPHSQGNATRLASGPLKHVVERFRPAPDKVSFIYSVMVEDPEYLTGRVEGDMRYHYRPDLEYSAVECSLDNARRFLRYTGTDSPP